MEMSTAMETLCQSSRLCSSVAPQSGKLKTWCIELVKQSHIDKGDEGIGIEIAVVTRTTAATRSILDGAVYHQESLEVSCTEDALETVDSCVGYVNSVSLQHDFEDALGKVALAAAETAELHQEQHLSMLSSLCVSNVEAATTLPPPPINNTSNFARRSRISTSRRSLRNEASNTALL